MDPFHGNGYAFWSGIGNDIPVFVAGYIFAFLPHMVMTYRLNRCHYHRCFRLGHHPYRHYKYCKHHHPEEMIFRVKK
jgi:hypothetical protein